MNIYGIFRIKGHNEVSASALYKMGLLSASEYRELMEKIENGEEVKVEAKKLNYEDIFENKNAVSDCIEEYNEGVGEEEEIAYTDFVGLLMIPAKKAAKKIR